MFIFVQIEPFKARHDIAKLDLTFPFDIPCLHLHLFEHLGMHNSHCTWLWCIGNCTKDPSHGFFARLMNCSQLVHGLRQSIFDYNALPLNYRDDWSWSSRWVFHGECTNVYGYKLDMTYSESWHWLLGIHDSSSYYFEWTLNLIRILSLYWSHQNASTYGCDFKVVIYYIRIKSLLMEVGGNKYFQ